MDGSQLSVLHEVFVWIAGHVPWVVAIGLGAPGILALLLAQSGRVAESAPVPELEPTPQPGDPVPSETPAAVAREQESGLPVGPRAGESDPAPVPARDPSPLPVPEPEPVRVLLRDRLLRTRESWLGRLGALVGGRSVDAQLLADLEAMLLSADLGVATAESLLETVKREAAGQDAEKVQAILRGAMLRKLLRVHKSPGLPPVGNQTPHVILMLGVNGSGKTTTIGKLAARYRAQGKKVVLGAGDTFRAAAVDQLQLWGERAGCEVIAGAPGGDPAAVAFDTVKAAIARKADVAIVDTAGRLQTQKPLMQELAKISRVLSRDLSEAPHETLLVLDANTGQNAISQARLFSEATALTGFVLTKLDGTAKGGVIVGLADEFETPTTYVGVGEGVEDLRDFDAEEFVDALLGDD